MNSSEIIWHLAWAFLGGVVGALAVQILIALFKRKL
jgi:hypothetical protein